VLNAAKRRVCRQNNQHVVCPNAGVRVVVPGGERAFAPAAPPAVAQAMYGAEVREEPTMIANTPSPSGTHARPVHSLEGVAVCR